MRGTIETQSLTLNPTYDNGDQQTVGSGGPGGVQSHEGARTTSGRIINNGSISAYTPRPRSAAYTASKHAITGLTRSTSLDGRAYNIACGQIDIGNAATEMTARMPAGVPQADGTLAAEPLMDVQAVADAVLFMASLPLEANVQFMTVLATKIPPSADLLLGNGIGIIAVGLSDPGQIGRASCRERV